MVLAQALKSRCRDEGLDNDRQHDRILLYTDTAYPLRNFLEESGWKLKHVHYVHADAALFRVKEYRLEGVFTKLHCLDLTEYDKVLMLDIDLAVMTRPDELFRLEAPAAMSRGIFHHEDGALLHSRRWFLGDGCSGSPSDEDWYWTQAGGINAGVMLFRPNHTHDLRMMREVHCAAHPL